MQQLIAKAPDLLPNVVFTVWTNGLPSDSAMIYTLKSIKLNESGVLLYEATTYQLGLDEFSGPGANATHKPRQLTPSLEVIREFGLTADYLKERLTELN